LFAISHNALPGGGTHNEIFSRLARVDGVLGVVLTLILYNVVKYALQ